MDFHSSTLPRMAVLSVNKPPGMTSRHALNRVQRLAKKAKLGHAGTLDPLAEGVLVVCLGKATSLVQYIQQMPKCYRAVFLLGRTSPTEDVESEVTELSAPPVPREEDIAAALRRFTGSIEQRPPAFSALRVEGRRAHRLAREGKEVELTPRQVHVYQLNLLRYAYPEMELEITCGSGTYVRSLGRDIAESLGTGAVMSGLVRTGVGPFRIEASVPLDALSPESWREHLLPPRLAVSHLSAVVLTGDQVETIYRGQPVTTIHVEPAQYAIPGDQPRGAFAGLNEQGELVSILRRDKEGRFWPLRNLLPGPQAKDVPDGFEAL